MMVENLIANKRLRMDEALSKLYGVQFFFSSVTGTKNNAKEKKTGKDKKQPSQEKTTEDKDDPKEDLDEFFRNFYPGVAYFIAYTRTRQCNPDTIFALLHHLDNDVEVKTIDSRIKGGEEEDIATEKIARELFQVVKDHDNNAVKSLVKDSNRFCHGSKLAEMLDGWSKEEVHTAFGRVEPRPPTSGRLQFCDPVRLVVVNQNEYGDIMKERVQRLRRDGMCLFFDILEDIESPFPSLREDSSSDLMQTIQDINKVMSNLSGPHVLYRGKVYAKPDGARFTFIEMMDTETYLHKLMASPSIREGILRNLEKLDKLMSNPACELFPQLQLDLDLIEVSNGKCLRISQRKFVDIPFTQKDFRYKSPRAYIPFDSTSEPDAKYFKEGIMNSFPEPEIRVNFLNKFYQCLMAGRMPHKVKKLVVHGPKDSGKTSWINVLLGIIPMSQVASITQERQFAASMIEESTQLVILDEWSENTLQSDMAKSVLQGGFMVKSVKHQAPKCINNTAPFYITTNILPNLVQRM